MSTDNRRNQLGPEQGMGQRANAQGLDLNRDWVKLESPEARAMVRALTTWDPHVTIDCHTTNGSHHRNALTFAGLLNPACHRDSLLFMRDELLPAVRQRLRERTGYETFFYGNFNRDHTVWWTYAADPRYSGPYCGLRGHMSVLSEAHAYIPYRDRVIVTREFIREIMRFVAENKARVMQLHEAARTQTTAAGANPQPDDCVGIRYRRAAFNEPVIVKGYVMEPVEGRRPRPTDEPKDYRVVHIGRFEPVVSVRRPYAYVIPPGLDHIVEKLRQHGIEVTSLEGKAGIEAYTVTQIDRAERAFQGHQMLTLDVEARETVRLLAPGSMLVRTAQPLGTLAVLLLEPRASDSLATWNFLDEHIAVGEEYPIVRVRAATDLH